MKINQLVDRKTLTLTRRDLAQMKLLTTANIGYKLLNIFKHHIGEGNAISHRELFKGVFGRGEEITLADEFRWEYVKKAMHLCRQRTKCFIGHKYERGVWKYFIVSDFDDARYFCNTLERNIGRMRAMQQKAIKSVREKWYKIDWIADSKNYLRWNSE